MKLDKFAVLLRMDEVGIRFQQDLAKKSGVSRVTLGVAMNGKSISAETVARLAAALETDPEKIAEFEYRKK